MKVKQQAKEKLVSAIVEAVYHVSSPQDPLLHRCGGNCRPDVMLALPFLLEIEMHKTEIAKLFGIKPTQVIKEIEHLLEEKERDKNTLRRKLALVRNHVYHNTGINIPMPTMA